MSSLTGSYQYVYQHTCGNVSPYDHLLDPCQKCGKPYINGDWVIKSMRQVKKSQGFFKLPIRDWEESPHRPILQETSPQTLTSMTATELNCSETLTSGTYPDPSKYEPSLYAAYASDIAGLLSRAEAHWLTAVQIAALEQLAEAFDFQSLDFPFINRHGEAS